jgi:hypothetical protein
MYRFPVSVFGRPRGFACAIAIAFVAGTAVGWSAALPSAPDAAIADAVVTKPWPVKPEFDLVFASVNAPLRKQDKAKPVGADSVKIAAVNFEDVFASFAGEARESTPSRREKLRNAGWRRLQSATQKPAAERVSAGEGRTAVN